MPHRHPVRHTVRTTVLAAAATATVLAFVLAPAPARAGERVLLSLPSLALEKGEKVKTFTITVHKGAITALPRVPWPWKLKLTNDEDDEAALDARAQTGLGSLKADFFIDFVEIELKEGARVRVAVDTTVDWVGTKRTIKFDDAQVARRKAGTP